MSEIPETGAAVTNVAAAPGSAAAPPGRASAGAPTPVSPRRRGRRLLLILFVVTCAVAVAAAAVIVVLVTQRPRQANVAAPPLSATVFRLHPGQCFDSRPNGIAGAHAIPCAQPHDGEIYGDFRMAGPQLAGYRCLGERARRARQSRLGGYLNPRLATTGWPSPTPTPTRAPGQRACTR